MNFQTFKITEENGYYVYFVSPFEDSNFVLEQVEHYLANNPSIPMCQYLYTCNFDKMQVEKSSINPCDVITKTLPQDVKCMNISNDFVSHIPLPKPKKEAKKKADKPAKEAKHRAKASKKVDIARKKPLSI